MKNVNAEVDKFLKAKKHPLTAEIQKVREIILQSDDNVEEVIKWSSPTFMYKGNIASFYMNAKGFVSLMFHKGAMIKDPGGLLEGEGKESRVARFSDLKDIERKKKALQTLIRNWIKFRDEDK
jgi:hypothetical protein